jgi:V8-like Glu-specific endopeptidase
MRQKRACARVSAIALVCATVVTGVVAGAAAGPAGSGGVSSLVRPAPSSSPTGSATPAAGASAAIGTVDSAAPIERVAVFGADDRSPVPHQYRQYGRALGLLLNERSRTVCTAFCVGEAMVATAAHCLFRTSTESPPKLSEFHFTREGTGARERAYIAGAALGAAAQHVMAGSARLNVDPPINAAADWALVRLGRPACGRETLAVRGLRSDDIVRESRAWRLFQLSYHRDWADWRLAYSKPCEAGRNFQNADWSTIQRDFADTTHLVLHTCDTGGASSGSPLLLDTPGGVVVVGINVGTYVQSRLHMEQRPGAIVTSDAVANTAVAAAAFVDRMATFQGASILASPGLVRDLQLLLRDRRYYEGRIDGAYGPLLRAAIEAFERDSGTAVLGLATEKLLVHLGGPLAEAPRRYVPSIGRRP